MFSSPGKRNLPVGRSKWVQKFFFLCVMGVYQGAEQWPRWKLMFETCFPHWIALSLFIALRRWDGEKYSCNYKKRLVIMPGLGLFSGQVQELWLMTITVTLMTSSSSARYRHVHIFPQQCWLSVNRGFFHSLSVRQREGYRAAVLLWNKHRMNK